MWIIGVDYHPSVQQIAFVNTDTGECGERRLSHSEGEAEKFYRELKAEGCSVRVGMEATGHSATRGSALSSQAPGYGVRGNQGREAVTRTCSVRMQCCTRSETMWFAPIRTLATDFRVINVLSAAVLSPFWYKCTQVGSELP